MKDTDYKNLVQLAYAGGGFIPANERAEELCVQLKKGEILTFKEVTARDVRFHRNYMALISEIWDYMPRKFKSAVPKTSFYQWLKHLKGQYEIKYTFADGTQLVEYESIAFGNMSEHRFRDYVREQLPYIYENVIRKVYPDEKISDAIIYNIEEAYKRFFAKL